MTGYLVEPDDEATLAERMLKVLADERLSRHLGNRARETALSRYAAEMVAAKTVAAYRQALDGEER